MPVWLQNSSVYADYAWFAAAALWVLIGWLSLQRPLRDNGRPSWVLWAAISGALVAGLEIVFHSLTYTTYYEPRLSRSLLLGCAGAGPALGLAWTGEKKRSHPWRTGATVLAFLGCAWLRIEHPGVAAGLEGAITLGFVLEPRAGSGRAGWDRRWIGFALVLAQVCGSAGIFAIWTREEIRWVDSSSWAWPAALMQVAVAGGLARAMAEALSSQPPQLRLVRRTVLRLSLLLAVGFLIAAGVSWYANGTFRHAAQARARTAALLLDGDALGALLRDGLTFEQRIKETTPEGWHSEIWLSARLQASDTKPLRAQLQRILEANPDARFVDFSIPREGGLLAILFPTGSPGLGNEAAWQRPLAETHEHSRLNGETILEGPLRNPWGTLVHALAPVRDSRGQFIGWLVMQWPSSVWAGSQLYARLLAFAVLAAAILIELLYLGRALTRLEKVHLAEQAATATAEAAARTAFLAKVSHELRTPLQGILGYVRLMQECEPEPAARRRLRQIENEAAHLQRLVEDLLDLSSAQTDGFELTPAPCDLRELVSEVVASFENRAGMRGLRLRQSVEVTGSSWALLDALRLRQVLINLLSNALKFTPTGEVVVSLQILPAGGHTQVEIVVADTGPGIPIDQRSRLFRPFSRLENAHGHEGSGLGLALSAAICRQMGGSLSLDDPSDAGSVFRVRMRAPRVGAADRADPATTPTKEKILRGLVLVVDDHPAIRELFQEWLHSAGVDCRVAASLAEARTLAARHTFDAAVLDLSIGGEDGCVLAREWHQPGPSTYPRRIVGVSAHASETARERALAAGMDHFLSKPIERHTLLAALELPTRSDLDLPRELQHRLRDQAVAEWLRMKTATAAALAAGDWHTVAANAHYLKNSADVLAHPALQSCCTRLEAAATREQRAAATEAFDEITHHFTLLP